MYTARVQNVTVTNVAQNLFEIIAAGATSLLIHAIRIEFVPSIVSGVGQDLRFFLSIASLSSTGTGGTAVMPSALHPRNTVAAVTTINSLVTSPGTVVAIKSASDPSVLTPYDRVFTSDQRIPVVGGGRLGIAITGSLGQSLSMSGTIDFEEY
jgi:hypothetical protein